MNLDFEDGLHFIRAAGTGLEAEGSVGGFEGAGIASKFGEDGEEALLDPAFRHAPVDGMHDWAKTERALESVIDFHRLPDL